MFKKCLLYQTILDKVLLVWSIKILFKCKGIDVNGTCLWTMNTNYTSLFWLSDRNAFMVCTHRWRACASACGTNPSNPLIVKTKQNSLRYAQRGCLNVWFVRNTPMAIFGPWKWRLDGPYIYKTYILANS